MRPSVRWLLRVLAGTVSAASAWIACMAVASMRGETALRLTAWAAFALSVSGLSLWFALGAGSAGARQRMTTTFLVAAGAGWGAFLLGFFVPMFVMDNNLGPLYGVFLTGPLGFAIGTGVGLVLSLRGVVVLRLCGVGPSAGGRTDAG